MDKEELQCFPDKFSKNLPHKTSDIQKAKFEVILLTLLPLCINIVIQEHV